MSTQPPKRRLLQFSLRGLVIFCAVACVWIGIWINRAREQAEVVEWVEKNGGSVLYEDIAWRNVDFASEHGSDYFTNLILDELAVRPKWKYIPLPHSWKSWLGPDLEWNVVAVSLKGAQISNLDPIHNLVSIKVLNIEQTQVFDLTPLTKFENLRVVQLNKSSDISKLSNLKKLKGIKLSFSDNLDLSHLYNLPHLERVVIDSFSSLNLNELSKFKQIKYLKISKNSETECIKLRRSLGPGYFVLDEFEEYSHLEPLTKLNKLKVLNLMDYGIDIEMCELLSEKLPNCKIRPSLPDYENYRYIENKIGP